MMLKRKSPGSPIRWTPTGHPTEKSLILLPKFTIAPAAPDVVTKFKEITLVLDVSGSMGSPDNHYRPLDSSELSKLDHAKTAIDKIIDSLSSNDYLTLISFDSSARFVIPKQKVTDKTHLKQLVHGMRADGQTNLGSALALLSAQNFTAVLQSSVFIITDGIFNAGNTNLPNLVAQLSTRCQNRVPQFYCLGISFDYSLKQLLSLSNLLNAASHTITPPIHISNPEQLAGFLAGLDAYLGVREEELTFSIMALTENGEECFQLNRISCGQPLSGQALELAVKVVLPEDFDNQTIHCQLRCSTARMNADFNLDVNFTQIDEDVLLVYCQQEFGRILMKIDSVSLAEHQDQLYHLRSYFPEGNANFANLIEEIDAALMVEDENDNTTSYGLISSGACFVSPVLALSQYIRTTTTGSTQDPSSQRKPIVVDSDNNDDDNSVNEPGSLQSSQYI